MSSLVRAGWAVLASGLTLLGVALMVPSVRSDDIGVFWPSEPQVIVAGLLILGGLIATQSAGALRYGVYALLAGCFSAYVLGLRLILATSGIKGIW